ncbi:DUF4328 domain-containing protein [Kitasatospora indigofera]|uniref:DUF4328 domain-containing protein n=1 Tax=Kitasatospora indigofera TaxID=67307 RepID=UPI0033A949EE
MGELVLGLTGDGESEFCAELGRWTPPLFAGGVVGFLGWFRRCRLNAEILSSTTHTYGRGRAPGAWFIPVLMWWAPRRAVLDIRRAGGSAGTPWLINTRWPPGSPSPSASPSMYGGPGLSEIQGES